MAYSKYKAVAVEVDGIRFSSKREAKRYQELRLLERAGHISGLQLQPSWTFLVAGKDLLIRSVGYPNGRKAKYVADFSFTDREGVYHVQDSKGFRTDVFKWKKALMEACHGIVVEEV